MTTARQRQMTLPQQLGRTPIGDWPLVIRSAWPRTWQGRWAAQLIERLTSMRGRKRGQVAALLDILHAMSAGAGSRHQPRALRLHRRRHQALRVAPRRPQR